ncbi:hypothetical protein Hte_008657 [Hypoxylon texense]
MEVEPSVLVTILVDAKVDGEAGKVERVSDDVAVGVTAPESADEAVDADDGSNVELGSNRVDNPVPELPMLVSAPPGVLVVFVQWTELLSMELSVMVAVPVVFDVKVDSKMEDGPPDNHELVLGEVLETFDVAEIGSCDVGTDVVEADVADETEAGDPGDPGSEATVPVFDAGPCDVVVVDAFEADDVTETVADDPRPEDTVPLLEDTAPVLDAGSCDVGIDEVEADIEADGTGVDDPRSDDMVPLLEDTVPVFDVGSWVVGIDVVEADVTDETDIDDPGSEDAVPVFEAGSCDGGPVPPLPVVTVAEKVGEADADVDASEPVLVDTGEPTEVSVEALPVDVTEFVELDDGWALPDALIDVVRVDPALVLALALALVMVLVQDSVLDRREGQATLHAQADMYARLSVFPHYEVLVSK